MRIVKPQILAVHVCPRQSSQARYLDHAAYERYACIM